MDTELFSGVKLPGRGVNSPPPSSAELPLLFLCALTASYRVNLHLQAFRLYISVAMARENIVLFSFSRYYLHSHPYTLSLNSYFSRAQHGKRM